MTYAHGSSSERKRQKLGTFTGLVCLVLAAALLSIDGHRANASAATSGPVAGIGIFRNGTSYSTGSGYDRYSYITVGVGDASTAGALPTKSLVYMSGTSVQTAWSTGVSYSEALANGWLLKDASGAYLRTPYSAYVGDVANAAYQQRFIDNVSAFLAAHGNEGVFIDDMYMSLEGFAAIPVKYPTQKSWEDATASFAAKVGDALKAKGFYVLFNSEGYIPGNSASDTGALTVTWWQRLAPHASGLLVEDWLQNPGNTAQLRSEGSSWYQNWSGWQSLVATAQSLGVDFLPSTSGTTTSIATMRYGKASFLLDWNGGGSAFVYSAPGDLWNLEWTMDIGQPAGAKYQVGVGWRRDYTSGTALVNPSATTSQTFALGGTYDQANGTAVTSVTLAPTSGIVLQKPSSTSAPPPAPPVNSALPVASGTAQAGLSLSASTGTWSGSPTSFAYQWQRCSSSGSACSPVSGASSSGYLLSSADVGSTMRVGVTATNTGGSTVATSVATAIVAAAVVVPPPVSPTAPTNLTLPSVTGSLYTKFKLAASTGTWSGSPTLFAYTWQRCDPVSGACTTISGTTGSTYTETNADIGMQIAVLVRATNAVGWQAATSPKVGPVRSHGWHHVFMTV